MPEQVQQPAPQPQVTTSQGINWKRIGLTVLIIIVVTGLIAGVYWFFVLNKSSDTSDLTGPVPKSNVTTATPSAEKDETAGWETYKSKNLGISINYPKEWVYQKEHNYTDGSTLVSLAEKVIPNDIGAGISVQIGDSGKSTSYREAYERYLKLKVNESLNTESIDNPYGTETRLPNVIVSEVEGLRIKEESKKPGYEEAMPPRIHVYIKKNNEYYLITLMVDKVEEFDSASVIFSQMLSTFKFLD